MIHAHIYIGQHKVMNINDIIDLSSCYHKQQFQEFRRVTPHGGGEDLSVSQK